MERTGNNCQLLHIVSLTVRFICIPRCVSAFLVVKNRNSLCGKYADSQLQSQYARWIPRAISIHCRWYWYQSLNFHAMSVILRCIRCMLCNKQGFFKITTCSNTCHLELWNLILLLLLLLLSSETRVHYTIGCYLHFKGCDKHT